MIVKFIIETENDQVQFNSLKDWLDKGGFVIKESDLKVCSITNICDEADEIKEELLRLKNLQLQENE